MEVQTSNGALQRQPELGLVVSCVCSPVLELFIDQIATSPTKIRYTSKTFYETPPAPNHGSPISSSKHAMGVP